MENILFIIAVFAFIIYSDYKKRKKKDKSHNAVIINNKWIDTDASISKERTITKKVKEINTDKINQKKSNSLAEGLEYPDMLKDYQWQDNISSNNRNKKVESHNNENINHQKRKKRSQSHFNLKQAVIQSEVLNRKY